MSGSDMSDDQPEYSADLNLEDNVHNTPYDKGRITNEQQFVKLPGTSKKLSEKRYASTIEGRKKTPNADIMSANEEKNKEAVPGGVDLSDLTSMKSAGLSTQYNIEQIDQIQELLAMNLKTYGFPDCGNLRSTKKKDVRQRLACIQAMLKQRIRDVEFREIMKQKGKANEGTQIQVLREKLKRHETAIANLEKEKKAFRNMCLEKDAEIQK